MRDTVKEPGFFFAIPFIDKVKYVVDQRELTIPIQPQSGITKDNVRVEVGGVLYVRTIETVKTCYGARRPLIAVTQHAKSR